MQVVVDQNLVEYQLRGDGDTTVLLLHGWTDSAQQSFAGLANQLAKSYRVLMPDLPGFGKSLAPAESWGVPEYGHWLKNFVDKLAVQPDIVIAHSNGGTLAIYALAYGLLQPRKLVLLGSAGIRDTARTKKRVLKLAAKPVKLLLKPLPTGTQERIKKRVYGQLGSDLYTLEHLKPIYQRVVAYDIQNDASLVKTPTLLIYGADDQSTPVSFGQTFQGLMPDARLEVVAAAGHYVHLDQPEKTFGLIEDFLA